MSNSFMCGWNAYSLRLNTPHLCVRVCFSICYIEAIDGEFTYDDGAAIVKNSDVNGNNSQ